MSDSNREMIWRRIVEPAKPSLSRAHAEAVLGMRFRAKDISRMNQLARRSNEGTLSAKQQVELEDYVQIGHLLTLLHSKARLTLGQRVNRSRAAKHKAS